MKEVQNRVRIRFVGYEKLTIHRIQNFGEDLWRSYRANNRVQIDLGEIDRATDEIVFMVRDTFLKKSLTEVHRLLKVHLMENEAVIDIEKS
ncbi:MULTISPECIES: hypothetical protein [Mesorhizobium]|uniref:hypothetical protein n=1 Tax=Mesorhizobium sp. TaxID=1871066 RepID=UPI0004941DD6|nr:MULTISPECIES: hypothetical protein [Mesorhizobium]RWM72458.1 MAG: hypothetical protein EOR82_13635 [Mesorhizobium sp.]TIO27065.1 MAG: hypothetical protein E5X83_07070 [Mesorhizobium sp.]TJV60485.1 MAG: hypothetical protein E5X82_13840 [Mesorhizobium sp.]